MFHEFSGIGHLGSEPEMRYTPTGSPVTSFSVAFSKKWRDKQGVQQEETLWVRVNAWEGKADSCAKYLHKGSKVFVRGELKAPRGYTDRDGTIRAALDMTLSMIRFLDGKGAQAESVETSTQSNAPVSEEDIPF